MFSDTGKDQSIELEDIQKAFNRGLKSYQKKRIKIEQSIQDCKQYLKTRQVGELLKCNLNKIRNKLEFIEVENIFDANQQKIKIELDISKNPVDNMEMYFDKAKKMEDALPVELARLNEINETIQIIENVIKEFCEKKDCDWGIKQLNLFGFKKFLPIQPEAKAITQKKSKNDPFAKIKKFLSCDGFWIFVGGSASENEIVSFKIGGGKDIWLHVAHMPGSHVIIKLNHKGDEIPRATLQEAAILAVHFSKLRDGSNVPVTYTLAHNVKKVKSAPTGTVHAHFSKTIKASDSKEAIQKLIIRTKENEVQQ